MGTFIVTRPSIDAGPVVEHLSALGHRAVVAPMMEIRFRDDQSLPDVFYQAVLITSANGARALARQAAFPRMKDVVALAVGKTSAAVARATGFQRVSEADGDVSGLIALARATLRTGDGPLLYVSGATTTGNLANELVAAGFRVDRVILYEAVAATRLSPAVRAAIEDGRADGVLLFSPRTARLWCRLVRAAGVGDKLAKVPHYCLSDNVKTALGDEGCDAVPTVVAARPEAAHLFALFATGPA